MRSHVNNMTMAQVVAELTALDARSGDAPLSASDQSRWDALTERYEACQESQQRLRDLAVRGYTEGPSTGPSGGSGPGVANTRAWSGDLRSAGLSELRSRALDAVEKAPGMPDSARELGTRLIEAETDQNSRLARFTITASNPAYLSAFTKLMQDPERGHLEWNINEQRAFQEVRELTRAMNLGGGSGSAGGFLVPYQLDPSILISSAGYVDPMRLISRVETTVQNEARFVTSAGVTASWDAEAEEVSDDSPTLAQPSIKAYRGSAFVGVSHELFDDSANLAQQVGVLFADAKANLESTAFTVGTGTGQAKGVVTAVKAVPGSVVATSTNVLAQSDLYTAQAALPPRWRQNANWMMNLSMLNGYRQLPAGSGLVSSIVNDDGIRPRALGWDVYENGAMDGTLTGSADDFTVLCGDFRQYIIVDRLGATIEFIPNLLGANGRPTGERGLYLRWRSGGDVVIPDAFRLLNHSA
ncbi:phage major capsid protein [Kitasatospora purpeofusca]|uniref:phage major capsid protein n=1 Tax=Kitasatospora purpeofusca TaxID=67352 RepID=UPI0033D981D5